MQNNFVVNKKTSVCQRWPIFLALAFVCMFLPTRAQSQEAASSEAIPPNINQDVVEKAVAAVTPTLVRIHVVEVEHVSGRESKQEAAGSGLIFTSDGYVITNHHVAGNAKQITCTLASKEDLDAELVGTDPLTDICVLKLRPEGKREFLAVTFGNSSQIRVGDPVLAMGSPLALSQSVTMGIISNTELVMPDVFWPFRFEVDGEDVGSIVRWIGHDAKISPGNSGGPLVNLQGEVIGINEMQFGLGGAIPGNLAQEVARQIIHKGKVVRAWIGLSVQPLLKSSKLEEGVLVSDTIPGSPARKSGFETGDILLSLDGHKISVRVPEELPIFNQLVAALPIGKAVEAKVTRGGKTVTLQVTAEERERTQPKESELSEWGITARNLSFLLAKEMQRENRDGVLVTSTRPGGPCEEAKPRILPRDVILEVAGSPVKSLEEMIQATRKITEGKSEPVPVLVAFDRKTERYLTVVKVGKERFPDPAQEVQKAWLPAAVQVLTTDMATALGIPGRTGVRVTQIYPSASPTRAGIQASDLLLALDGKPIAASRPEDVDVFPAMIRQYRIGSEVELTIVRGEVEQKIKVTLERSPRPARELRKYRNDLFDFTARDSAFEDRMRENAPPPEARPGAFVEAVKDGGWAALAHLAVGDVILEVDSEPTPGIAALEKKMTEITSRKPKALVFRIQRGIHELYLELKPKWPEK